MAENLVFLVVLLLSIGICSRTAAPKRNWMERGIMAGAAVLTAAAVTANLLAAVGKFSLWGIALVLGCLSVVALCCNREKTNVEKEQMCGWDKAAALLLAVAFCLSFFFPVKYLLAGRDPGVYLINGVHIAQTGSIEYESDEWLDEHYEEAGEVVSLFYPAYYSEYEYQLSENPGKVVTQFLHMYPSVLAVGYRLSGLEGLVRVNAVIAFFSLGVIYCMARRMFSPKAACIALLFLTVNPAQIWSGRITQSEILSQLILFLGIWIFYEGWERDEKKCAVYAGILFGLSTFNRIDTYIIGAGILLTLGYCELFRVKRQYMRRTAGIYLGLGLLSLLYGFHFSYPYYEEHLKKGLLAVLLLNAGLLAATGFLVLFRRMSEGKEWTKDDQKIKEWIRERGSRWLTVLLGGLGVFAYVFRPLLFQNIERARDRYAMQQFCWYTTILGILFMLYGIFQIFRKQKNWEAYLLFLGISLTNMLVYIFRPSISADHIFMSRRWIFVCIPAVLILAGHGIVEMRLKKDMFCRALQGAAVFLISVFFLYESRVFLIQKMYDGMEQQYEAAVESLEDDRVYVTNNTSIAGIYRFMYGKQVYLLKDAGAKLEEYLEDQELFYLGNPGGLDPFCVQAKEEAEIQIRGIFLEKSTEYFPRSLYEECLDSSIYRLTPAGKTEVEVELDTLTLGGLSERTEQGIVCEGEGYAFWGPYMNLEPGTYRVEFELETEIQGEAQGTCQAAVNGGMVLVEQEITGDGTIALEIQAEEKLNGLEFRIEKKDLKITCKSIRLIKED